MNKLQREYFRETNKFASLSGVFLYNNKMEDNRNSQRQPIMVRRDCDLDVISFKQHERTDHHGHIVDISKSGIGIESNKPMEPGLVWFKDHIWGQSGGVLLWSRQVGAQYRSGIRFVPLPNHAALGITYQSGQSVPHEPLKDLERLVAIQLESIKQNPVLGNGIDWPAL